MTRHAPVGPESESGERWRSSTAGDQLGSATADAPTSGTIETDRERRDHIGESVAHSIAEIGARRVELDRGRYWEASKRGFDITASMALLLALVPVLLLIAVAIRAETGGPVIFRQRRCGRDLGQFTLLKFRTMHHGVSPELHRNYIAELASRDSASLPQRVNKLTGDPRVTRVGTVLRRLSLDELPQLVNVLAGDMSLIGPRPLLEYELEFFEPEHFERFRVRPGMSGLWQVSGRSTLAFNEMLALDVEYARSSGLWVDARIFVRTPLALFRRTA